MRAWPVARSIFDAPLCERSERADNKLDKVDLSLTLSRHATKKACIEHDGNRRSMEQVSKEFFQSILRILIYTNYNLQNFECNK